MRRFVILLLSLLAMAVPAHAEEAVVYEVIEETIEITEFVDEGGSERFVGNAPAAIPQGIARFGPFRVLDGTRAAMVDATDSASPNTALPATDQPSHSPSMIPSAHATAICAIAPGTAILRTDSRSFSEK